MPLGDTTARVAAQSHPKLLRTTVRMGHRARESISSCVAEHSSGGKGCGGLYPIPRTRVWACKIVFCATAKCKAGRRGAMGHVGQVCIEAPQRAQMRMHSFHKLREIGQGHDVRVLRKNPPSKVAFRKGLFKTGLQTWCVFILSAAEDPTWIGIP